MTNNQQIISDKRYDNVKFNQFVKIKYLFYIVFFMILGSCKEKLSDDQITKNENKKYVDSLYYTRRNLIHEYSDSKRLTNKNSLETVFIANKIIDNSHLVLNIDNENLDAVEDLAFYNYELEDFKEAIFFYSRIIEIRKQKNKNATIDSEYLYRGTAKFHLQDFNGAIKDLEKYKSEINNDKTNGFMEACYYLGKSYNSMNDKLNACENFRLFAELQRTDQAWEYVAKNCN